MSTVNARGQVLTDLLGVSLTLYRETDGLGRITWTQDAIGGETRYWFDGVLTQVPWTRLDDRTDRGPRYAEEERVAS
jgi:hypothetical protein